MKKLKNKGFTKTELIIVIAIVAVLAATLIPTFVSLAKNKAAQEQTNQQLADLAEKVENQQTLTIEDIKAQIAAQIAGIQLPEGVDADDVNKAIADAIAGIKIPEAGLTDAQVQAIIDNAIKNIKLPEAGLSAADVEKIVTEAIAGIKLPEGGLSADEIKQIVNEAIKGVGSSLSAKDVQKIVDAAIAGLKIPEAGLSAADVEKIIAEAIAGIKIPEAGPTAADVEKMINDAIAAALQNIKPGVTDAELKAAIEAAIKEALAQLEGTYLTDEQIQALIDKALAGLKPEETEPEETKPAAPVVSSVVLNNTYLELAIGTAVHLKATALDQYGNVVADAVIRWSSHNTVCTFVNNGVVYAIAPGTTVVTATVEGTDIFANCYVVVTGTVVPDPSIVPVQSVALNKTTATLEVGQKTELTATVIPTNATNVAVVWTSSNTAVATVKNGVVTAVGAGTATITVTTVDGNKTATCAVTVKAPAPAVVPVTGVTIKPLEEAVYVGDRFTLTATVAPASATNKNVTWTSSNTAVATVNAKGVINALAEGTAIITVTTEDGGFTATITINVEAIVVPDDGINTSDELTTALPVDPYTAELAAGTYNVQLTGDIAWDLDAAALVIGEGTDLTIDLAGNKLAVDFQIKLAGGNLTILNGEFATSNIVNVASGELTFKNTAIDLSSSTGVGIQNNAGGIVNVTNCDITASNTETVVYPVSNVNGGRAIITDSTITTNDLPIVIQNANGGYLALNNVVATGTTVSVSTRDEGTNTAINGGTYKSIDDAFMGVIVSMEDAIVEVNGCAIEVPEYNGTVNSLVKMYNNGLVIGSLYINGKLVTFEAPVVPEDVPVASVSLNANKLALNVGDMFTLIATVLPEDATNKGVVWSTDNINVASVDNNGVVTANGNGTAIITVTTLDGTKVASCNVTVTTRVTGVALSKTSVTLEARKTTTITVKFTPTDASNKNVTWTSSNPAVATVTNGKILAVSNGTAVITVTTEDGGYTAQCVVTVKDATVAVTGVTLNTTEINLTVGSCYILVPTISPVNATNKAVTWNSSNPSVATIDANGEVTAVAPGSAIITVTTSNNGKTATCLVIVTEAPIGTGVSNSDEMNAKIPVDDIFGTIEAGDFSVTLDANIDWELRTSYLVINDGTNLTIDLNSQQLDVDFPIKLDGGSLTLVNGNLTTSNIINVLNGNLTLTNATVVFNSTSGQGIQNNTNGTITIDDCHISASNATYASYAISNSDGGRMIVNNTTVSSTLFLLINNGAGGYLELNNVMATGKNVCISAVGTGTKTVVNGGTYKCVDETIMGVASAMRDAVIVLNGCTINVPDYHETLDNPIKANDGGSVTGTATIVYDEGTASWSK